MRTPSTSHDHRTTSIVPPILCNHPEDVAKVTLAGPYRVQVIFHDGTSGIVDLSRLIVSPNAGVFATLRDESVFAQVEVRLGAVTWPGDIDLAPDAMYLALKSHGEWILE